MIAGSSVGEPKGLQRLLREAQVAARLQHANVVAIHDIDQEQGTYYLVIEYVPGPSAQQIIDKEGALPWRVAVQIVLEACRGLVAAHATHLIHRDIKPSNLLVSRSGEVKLSDFGLAKVVSEEQASLTTQCSVIGTPQFMSPEQAKSEHLDERSDLYSLGATLYALLTGEPPFPTKDLYSTMYAHQALPVPDLRRTRSDIPEECVRIIRRAMAKSRADRYADAQEMLADLEAVLGPQREPLGPLAEKFDIGNSTSTSSIGMPSLLLRHLRLPKHNVAAAVVLVMLALLGLSIIVGSGAALWLWFGKEWPHAEDSPGQLRRDLMARNPGFNGKFAAPLLRDGRIVKLALDVENITEITQLGQLTDLEDLDLFTTEGNVSKLKDVTSIGRLTKLTRLRVTATAVEDFSYLRELKSLQALDLSGTNISDLTIISQLPLAELRVGGSRVKEVRGLEKMPLEKLDLGNAYGLQNLDGLPTKKLRWLSIASTPIRDLGALRDAGELQYLDLHWARATIAQRHEMPRRSLHPDDMAILLRLKKLAEVIGEFTEAEEARLRKELPSLRIVQRVPPGK